MLSCMKATRTLSEAQEQNIKLMKRIPVMLHLWICPPCRNFNRQMTFMRVAARQYPKQNRG